MTDSTPADVTTISTLETGEIPSANPKYMAEPGDSYTKLAMRNMVRRGGTSLFHFFLTLVSVLGGLGWLVLPVPLTGWLYLPNGLGGRLTLALGELGY